MGIYCNSDWKNVKGVSFGSENVVCYQPDKPLPLDDLRTGKLARQPRGKTFI